MKEVGRQIVFLDLQILKGNKNKRIPIEIGRNLALFKSIDDDNEFNKTYAYIINNKSTVKYINANLFPLNINDIARYKEIGFSNNLIHELRWQFMVFSTYKDTINIFLESKLEIEELILLNKYEKALDILCGFEKRFGVSFWLLETKIFLWNKLGKNTQEEIINKSSKGLLTTILSFYNMRSSEEVSSRDYDYFTRKELAKFERKFPNKKEVTSFYNYMIAPYLFAMDDENVLHILAYIHDMTLIDRYLCIIDICGYILTRSQNINYQNALKNYINYIKEINDGNVNVFRFMLDSNYNRCKSYTIDDQLINIKSDFISGNIDICNKEVARYIKENKSNITAYNIFIETCQILGKNIVELGVSENVDMLIKNLNSIYSIDERYNEAIDLVYKLIYSCIHATWARDIYNNISRRSQPLNSDEQKIAVMFTNMQNLTLETVCENLNRDDAIEYLDNNVYNGNIYVKFWRDFLAGEFKEIEKSCGLQPLKKTLQLLRSSSYNQFEEELIGNKDLCPIYKIRYSKILWDNMTFDTYIEQGIDYFLDLFIEREDYAIIAPMKKFMDYYFYDKTADKSNLRVPILYYIYSTYFEADKRVDLTIACENFFFYNDIDKPSLIDINKPYFTKNKLIFFLYYVCIPQIMGPVLLSLRSPKELDQERINTCQCLRILNPEDENLYEQEIRDITHKLFINDGLNTIENSKIHVNTDGIKSRISKNMKSAFNNYMYYRNHKIDAVLETIKNIEGGENLQIITFDTSQMFNEIVYTIRNEFVSGGEYGLDGYLSINIRHGTLSGQLKAPLSKFNLITTYLVESDTYDISERWLYQILSNDEREIATEAIIAFNKEIEDIINYLKKTLIQVSTEEKPSKGVFDYALIDADIKFLQTLLTENCQFEEFIDKVFDYLWNMTERNLQRMKIIIQENVTMKFLDAFSELTTVYRKINETSPFPEALRWLNEAQNELDAEIEKICHWFKRSAESQNADFDLDLAFQIGFKMIENIHPDKNFVIKELKKDFMNKIPGRYLKNYWDIFYTMFDNVSKYATSIGGQTYISCDLKVNSNYVYIKMINDYDCSCGVEDKEAKIENAMQLISDAAYLSRAKQEGGSGIPKIYKIMSIDLDKKPSIRCNFLRDTNQFVIEVEGKRK